MVKKIISTAKAPKAVGPYSQAVKADNLLFVSGQLPLHPATGDLTSDIKGQTKQVLENLKAILSAAGASLSDVVKTTVFLKDLGDFNAMNEVFQEYFTDSPPERATVQVAAIPKGALVEIEAIALLNGKQGKCRPS